MVPSRPLCPAYRLHAWDNQAAATRYKPIKLKMNRNHLTKRIHRILQAVVTTVTAVLNGETCRTQPTINANWSVEFK